MSAVDVAFVVLAVGAAAAVALASLLMHLPILIWEAYV